MVLAKCAQGCPWRLWVSYMKMKTLFRWNLIIQNTNVLEVLKSSLLILDGWLKYTKIKYKVTHVENLKILRLVVLERYDVIVTVSQCYKDKRLALGEVESALKEHYARLCLEGALCNCFASSIV